MRRVVCVTVVERVDVFLDAGDDNLTTVDPTPLPRMLIQGGTGSDEIHAGSGNDRIEGGSGLNQLFGRAGNDELIGGIGNDLMDTDLQQSVENAGVDSYAGNDDLDVIGARDGVAENVFCGSGRDRALLDLKDDETGIIDDCENQEIGAVRESPNIRLRGRISRGGLVRLRLACPLAVPFGCRGRLTLHAVNARLRSKGRLARRVYRRLAPGASRRLRIRLRGRALKRARRYRTVRVTSREQGQHGAKTTVITLRVPRASD